MNDEYAPTYKIAFSAMATGKLPSGDPRWEPFTRSFINHEMDILSIYNEIFLGHSYCAWLNGDRRKSDNFMLAQHIAIDLDTEDKRSDIDRLVNHPMYRAYGGMIHTSPSHRPNAPRARVMFFLDQPITNGEGYSKAYETVASFFDGADTVCKDPARFFYGAVDCFAHLGMRELPVAHIRTMYKRMTKEQPRAVAKPPAGVVRLEDYRQRDATEGGDRLVAKLGNMVQDAHEGSRNHTLNKAAFLAGKMAAKNEVDPIAVEHELKAAARAQGLEPVEITKTFNSGFNAGRKAV
jgi:hypothetical protein